MNINNTSLFKTQAYLVGEWCNSASGESFAVKNPFDNMVIAEVQSMNAQDCQKAIEGAHQAFQTWRQYSAIKRSKILKKWYQLQIDNLEDLATILTLEQGKPISEARGEIKYGASFVEWFAEEAMRIYGDVIPGHSSSIRATVIKQPVGVVGAITPWNFPNAMITRKVAPALAAGCSVIIKPSELTPLSALALAQLAEEAGIPKGVFNVITAKDPQEIGQVLTQHPLVKKISFTGSTTIGKKLLAQSASTVKKISLELGGNAPLIVFKNADIDLAVNATIASKFRNAGQTCICTNRIFIHERIYETFLSSFLQKLESLKTGNGMDESINIGPLISNKAIEKINRLIEDAKVKGANVVYGGTCSIENPNIFEPTVITNADRNMAIYNEEIFGPVGVLYPFKNEIEVLEMANDTRYGLAAYFFGKDYAQIWRVAEALEFGMVGINSTAISSPLGPFGGIKESGYGREGSKYGIEEFLNIKYMCWGAVK